MNEEKINYAEHVLGPENDVFVPISPYTALVNVCAGLEKQELKKVYTIKFSYYNRVTHEKLSAKSQSKMKVEKLAKEYYQNIDLEATKKTESLQISEIGLAAIQLNGEFQGIFRHNVDKGNSILREQIPAPVAPATNEVAGPTLVEDDSKE